MSPADCSPMTDHRSPITDHFPPIPLPSTQRAERAFLLAIGVAFLLFVWPVLRLIVQVYETNPDYAHGYLIPLVAAYAGFILWKERPGLGLGGSWRGLPLVAAGAATVFMAVWYHTALVDNYVSLGAQFIAGCGLWLALAGLAVCLLDRPTLRRYRFPLFYLLFAIPLPASLTKRIVLSLRAVVSHWAEQLLNAGGMLVYREGNLLHLPNVSLGIEDACSGIRSLAVMIAWSVAAAWITGCRHGRFALIVLLALPIALLQNLLRVLASAILAYYVDPLWAEGWRHETVGWVTFVLAAAAFVLIANRVAAADSPAALPKPTAESHEVEPAAPGDAWRRFHHRAVPLYSALLAMFALTTAAHAVVRNHYALALLTPDPPRKTFAELPREIGEFQLVAQREIPAATVNMIAPTDHFSGTYQDPWGKKVNAMLLYWGSQERPAVGKEASPHDPDICLPGSGWERQPEADFEPNLEQSAFDAIRGRVYTNQHQQRVLVFWWNRGSSTFRAGILQEIHRRLANLFRSWSQARTQNRIRYSVYVFVDECQDLSACKELAESFADTLRQLLHSFGVRGISPTPNLRDLPRCTA